MGKASIDFGARVIARSHSSAGVTRLHGVRSIATIGVTPSLVMNLASRGQIWVSTAWWIESILRQISRVVNA